MTGTGPAGLVVLAPLRIEARAVRAGAPAARVVRTGMGAARARRAAAAVAGRPGTVAVAVAGFGGGLAAGIRPCDVVLASELRDPAGAVVRCCPPGPLAAALRAAGLRVHVGPLASAERLVTGPARARLRATGALAVDMESAWLAPAAPGLPFAVVRVVVDTEDAGLFRPGVLPTGLRAYRALRTAAAALAAWAPTAVPGATGTTPPTDAVHPPRRPAPGDVLATAGGPPPGTPDRSPLSKEVS